MELKLYDYGCPPEMLPRRAHKNDVGADVYAQDLITIWPGETKKVGLGFGVEIPPGCAGFLMVRSSMAVNSLDVKMPPIDPYYTGEVHALISNTSTVIQRLDKGSRIGQLVIVPVYTPDFTFEPDTSRQAGGFGSTGS